MFTVNSVVICVVVVLYVLTLQDLVHISSTGYLLSFKQFNPIEMINNDFFFLRICQVYMVVNKMFVDTISQRNLTVMP